MTDAVSASGLGDDNCLVSSTFDRRNNQQIINIKYYGVVLNTDGMLFIVGGFLCPLIRRYETKTDNAAAVSASALGDNNRLVSSS